MSCHINDKLREIANDQGMSGDIALLIKRSFIGNSVLTLRDEKFNDIHTKAGR